MEDIRTYRTDEEEDDDRTEYNASPQAAEDEVPFHIPRD
jgi:hypothetical protein